MGALTVAVVLIACSGANQDSAPAGSSSGARGAAASGSSGAGATGGRGGRGGSGGPIEVGVIVMQPQRAALTAELPGRTVAYRIAQVRPQISGIIQKRLYNEGAAVQAGQALYQIDPGTYRAAYESASAAVAKAEANALTVKLRYDRYQKLAQSGVVSQQDRDDVTANLRQSEADLANAKASLHAASINLNYTRIVAPIAGRIGTSEYTEGALVTTNQTAPLTTVTQLNPMYVDLTQSSNDLLRLRAQFASGAMQKTGDNKARVKLILGDGSSYDREGVLEFTGVTVSESTGAITLRAVVPNPDGVLLPGMFVRARIQQGVDDKALLVPQSAVSRTSSGDAIVLVAAADGKLEQRSLSLGSVVDDSWQVISGLSAGERLVVEGLQKVKAGDTARIAIIKGK
jgi:membrane fusion protein (multidrug efflux system)